MRPLVAIACWGLLSAAAIPSQGASVADWRQDLEEIVRLIRATHPDPFAKVGETVFVREAEALEAAIPSLSGDQRLVHAMRLVAMIGDGHTQLEPASPRFASWYPLRLYEFSDGVFVTSAHRSVSDLAGTQILEIAGRPVTEVLAAARALMGADNAFGSRENLYAVHNAAMMKGLGYAGPDAALRVRARLRGGRTVDRTLVPSPSDDTTHYAPDDASFEWQVRREMAGMPFGSFDDWISAYGKLPFSAYFAPDTSRPAHLVHADPYVVRPFPAQDGYYVQINRVDDTEFVAFIRRMMQDVDRRRPRRLIIDLRFNFGGDGSRITPMIHEFIKRADARPWKELYLLTGRRTFSAGIMALDAFLDHTECSVVGEPPAAALNSYGDATSIPLTRSGLLLAVSTLRHQLGDSDDFGPFIAVDVPAIFSFADYVAGRDPAVDPILRGDEMRSLAAIAMAEGGGAARMVWLERKSRVGALSWWGPPPEIALRRVGRALIEQNRIADAIENNRLNTEVHPDNWRTWLNLGLAYKAAGRQKERLDSYRRVLELDPNNFNGDAIRRLLQAAERK
ncbi:MAG: hypothetical protein ACRENJ_08800 [Candidatus Eiseniibacteriota bacterium]